MKKNTRQILFLLSVISLLVFTFFPSHILNAQIEREEIGKGTGRLFSKIVSQFNETLSRAGFKTVGTKDDNITEQTLLHNIGRVVGYTLNLLGIVFIILVVYGGFLWMTAKGNEEQVTKAKNIITRGSVGVGIILSAYIISFAIASILAQQIATSTYTPSDTVFSEIKRALKGFLSLFGE